MHSFRTSTFFVLLASTSLAQIPASTSGSRHDEPLQLENVLVTASPYARHQTELAQPTSVLAGRELLLNQSTSIGELLSGQPGVSSTYFGPAASRPVIRGMAGDRIRILTDGVGTIDASVISPDHAVSLDPLLIERVEIVRGPATLLYGGNAVGGVINIIDHRIHTTRPAERFNGRIETRFASANDEASGGAVFEGGEGNFAWHADAYRRNAGNIEIPGFAESAQLRAEEAAETAEHGEEGPEEIAGYLPNSAVVADGGAAGFSFIGERGYVGFAYAGHNTLYGIPSGGHEHAHEEESSGRPAAEEEAVRVDLQQRRVDVQAAITESFGVFSEARLKLGFAKYRHAELEGEEIGTVFRNRGYDGRLELLHTAVGPFTGEIGWQGSRSDFAATGAEAFLPPSRTDTHALFLFEEAELKPLVWQLGGRIERQNIELRDRSPIAHDQNTFSASTGVVWTASETWTLSTSLVRAERAANTQELFADGPHAGTQAYEIGDPTLAPEKSLALDITLRKRVGFVTGAVTVFANRFSGFIFEQPTGQVAMEDDGGFTFVSPEAEGLEEDGLAVYQFVQQDARFYGGELETIFHLLHTDRHQLDLIVNADVVRARTSDPDANLPRITPARLKTGLAWTRGVWSLGGDVQWVARQKHRAAYESPTPGYSLASAYATYRFALADAIFDVFVRGTNLGNDEARLHTSFLKDVAPLAGRSITVGVRASF